MHAINPANLSLTLPAPAARDFAAHLNNFAYPKTIYLLFYLVIFVTQL